MSFNETDQHYLTLLHQLSPQTQTWILKILQMAANAEADEKGNPKVVPLHNRLMRDAGFATAFLTSYLIS